MTSGVDDDIALPPDTFEKEYGGADGKSGYLIRLVIEGDNSCAAEIERREMTCDEMADWLLMVTRTAASLYSEEARYAIEQRLMTWGKS